MKHIFHIIYTTLLILTLTGCYEWADNGDFDGMWQLTEWRDKQTNEIVATNESGIYYCVQLELMKFQQSDISAHYLSYFTLTPDSLVLGKVISYPTNEEASFTQLSKYGVPDNGRFHVDALTDSRMQLSTDEAVLLFRKY